MTTNSPLTVIVASYVSSEDARTDLRALDNFYWSADVGAYDAALVVTDAWSQVRVEARSCRRLEDVSAAPLLEPFTALFGGSFITGKVPPPPWDNRLPESALRELGLVLPADSVLIVAVGQPDQPARAPTAFGRADWVQSQAMERQELLAPELRQTILDLIGKGAAARAVRTA